MQRRTVLGVWLLAPAIAMVACAARASDITVTVTLKGKLGEGQVFLYYYGVGKKGECAFVGVPGTDGSIPFSAAPPDSDTWISGKGAGKDWTFTLQKTPKGWHLIEALFKPKGIEELDWHHPMTWKWVHVEGAKDPLKVEMEVDLSPKPTDLGSIEVVAPEGVQLGKVGAAPIDGLDLASHAAKVILRKNEICDTIEIRDLSGFQQNYTLKGLPPGKYRVADDSKDLGTADVEVKAGETVQAKLEPAGGKK